MIGIYKITSPSNRIYIGQSINIEKRFIGYKRMYVKNNKQTKLHRSFLKYNVKNHVFEIIEECDIILLNERERYFQDYYNVLVNGLNCNLTKTNDKSGKASKETLLKMSKASLGNTNFLGKKHTEETKKLLSLSHLGKKHSDEVNKSKGRKGRVSNMKGLFSENNPRSIKIIQLDLNGNFLREWNCLMDVKRELGFHIGNISSCLKGNLKTYKKFKWEYK